MIDKWDKFWMQGAHHIATRSKDPSTKVGCVIVDPELQRRVGEGFNGFPRFMSDAKELYEDRETKYSRMLHAELNAVLFSKKTEGCIAYITATPCNNCALVLIQSGINRVVAKAPSADLKTRWGEQFERTRGFFAEAEIEYEEVG
jgi:dCMP deaminase